ncbi:MAG: hypothetical protein ABSH41_27470 [Syntrophobacteraceae bacterium]
MASKKKTQAQAQAATNQAANNQIEEQNHTLEVADEAVEVANHDVEVIPSTIVEGLEAD